MVQPYLSAEEYALIDGTIPPEMHEKYLRRVIAETDHSGGLFGFNAVSAGDHSGGMRRVGGLCF